MPYKPSDKHLFNQPLPSLTKMELYALAAMHGLLSGGNHEDSETVASRSAEIARLTLSNIKDEH